MKTKSTNPIRIWKDSAQRHIIMRGQVLLLICSAGGTYAQAEREARRFMRPSK